MRGPLVWPSTWRLALAAVALALAVHGFDARAETYPSRAIRLIVPYPAAGGIDTLARLVSVKLSDALGRPILVENFPGAGGNIGTDIVAKAAPDGYTLVLASNSIVINPAFPDSRAPDPLRTLSPITKLVTIAVVVAVTQSFAARTLEELFAMARKAPRTLAYANQGIGTTSHMAAVLLSRRAGVEMIQVPYSGTGSVARDVISGEIPILFSATGTVTPYVKSGHLRALAVTGSERSSSLPEVPTVAEAGYPGFEVTSWYGVLAPAGTAPEIVNRLHVELTRIVAMPEIRESLAGLGMVPVGNTPAQFADELRSDVLRWARVVRESGIGVR